MHSDLPSSRELAGPLASLRGWIRGPWSLRAGIHVFQALVALMLLTSAAATFLVIDRINHLAELNELDFEQLRTVTLLAARLNRHSENVAELLLLGRSELGDLEAAREDLAGSLDALAALVEQEIELLRSASDLEGGLTERERVARMRALYAELDATAEQLLALVDQGRREDAAALFRDAVEDGLSAELDRVIAEAIADEEAELAAVQASSRRLKTQLVLTVLGISVLATLVTGAAGARLSRVLTKAVREVVGGTRAIGDGHLSYRIRDDQPEEFADLARQFNAAAGQLEVQRRQLLDVQAGLEAEIGRRTGQLEEANARLQRLDQMRMLFLADISHELRTPLTILQGEAEVALRGEQAADEYRGTLHRVVQIASQMGRLVDDLLFLARAEVGAIRFDLEPVIVQDLLDVALLDAEVLAESRGVAIHSRTPSAPLRVDADAGRLAQALLIVLDNAVKYSDPTGTVEVDLHKEGQQAIVQVVNRGPTISKADLPFVFNRFHRGRPSGTQRPEGSGLGLPIAKWILDTLGGSIEITSEAGRTVVTICLNLKS